MATNRRLEVGVRWARRVLVAAMVVVAALVLRSFSFRTLDDAQHVALAGKVRPGAILIVKDIDDDTVIGAGSLVEASVRLRGGLAERVGRTEGLILTEIRGVPGMEITWLTLDDGSVEIELDGRRTFARMRPDWQADVPGELRVREGPIPDGLYLLINPAVEAEALDSRRIGLVRREDLLRKVGWL